MKIRQKYRGLNLKSGIVATDTETTGLNSWGTFERWGFYPARPFAFSFCDVDGNTAYVRWKVDPKTRRVIPNEKDLPFLRSILSNPDIVKVGHNIAYDIRMCEQTGIEFKGEVHDTLIMAHIVTQGREMQYGLKYLGKKYLGVSDDDEKELQKAAVKSRHEGKKRGWFLANKDEHGREPVKADYWMAPPKLCEKYAVRDAERTMLFYLALKPMLDESENFQEVYAREMKVFQVIRKMENLGTRVFPKEVKRLRKDYEVYMEKHKKVAEVNGGKDLNFRSPKQMTRIFYMERGLSPREKKQVKRPYWTVASLIKEYKAGKLTKKQLDTFTPIVRSWGGCNPRVNGDDLVYFADVKKDTLARSILEHRGAGHMITAFLNPYDRFMVRDCADRNTWILHPNFKQFGTVTGRFSCGDPNLMQVASETTGRRKTAITLKPRECLGPRDGHLWYMPDYSQVEVWAFAFLAEEKAMMNALLSGEDFHGSISKQVWGGEKDYTERKSYYRKRAKLLMFCKLYGGGTKKVAFLLEASEAEAKLFVDQYNAKLPGVNRFMRRMINRAERERKITNPFGREYYMEPKFSYKAVNYMIQGTCADLMKEAMINVDRLFCTKWKGCNLLLTLHDELIIEVPEELHSKKLMRDVVLEMQRDSKRIGLPVPLPVSMKIAREKWANAKDINFVLEDWKETYIYGTGKAKTV